MGFPWPFPGLDFAIYPQARRYVRRIVFVILRTASSPPVAPHPASWRRSYLRLPGAGISRKGTFTPQIAPAFQAHGFRFSPE